MKIQIVEFNTGVFAVRVSYFILPTEYVVHTPGCNTSLRYYDPDRCSFANHEQAKLAMKLYTEALSKANAKVVKVHETKDL
jgi:hypothetical protein